MNDYKQESVVKSLKKLITVNDMRTVFNNKEKHICVDDNTIVTPAAKDCAHELGIKILKGDQIPVVVPTQAVVEKEEVSVESIITNEICDSGINITEELLNEIVKKVVAKIGIAEARPEMVKECDPSGIRLVRGNTVKCDRFDTGIPTDKVGIKEVLNIKECPNMATGFLEIENSSFDWTLGYDEVDYIIEGSLEITIDGRTYIGNAGDVFYIPKDSSITFKASEYCKFFFSTYPANWQELSNNK